MNRVGCGFAALLVTAGGLHGATNVESQESLPASIKAPSTAVASFSLVDEQGRPVTDEDFRGSYMLVYFGYTYCPDVCPMGLQIMSQVIRTLGPSADRVVPIFITVDPERDTSEVLAAYTAHFHPRLIGLTGSREQIDAAEKNYAVRSFKLFLPPSFDEDQGERSDEDENSRYLMQHSASTYLVGPDGGLERTFPHDTPPLEMARQIQGLVNGGH